MVSTSEYKLICNLKTLMVEPVDKIKTDIIILIQAREFTYEMVKVGEIYINKFFYHYTVVCSCSTFILSYIKFFKFLAYFNKFVEGPQISEVCLL